jgi:Domain of unknown function (DUF4214)/Sulfotransferase family
MNNNFYRQSSLDDVAFLQATSNLSHEAFLELAYRTYLKRIYEQAGFESYLNWLYSGDFSRQQVLAEFRASQEFKDLWNFISSLSGIEIISVHLPKTAGTAFGKVLEKVYSSEKIIRDDCMQLTVHRYISPEVTSNFKVIHGHFDARSYNGYFPDAKRIVWVRHPIFRLISNYFYWKSLPRELVPENIDAIDIVEFSELYIHNEMSLFLNGTELSDFYFVGIQEFFKSDLSELSQNLDWSHSDVFTANTNEFPNYQDRIKDVVNNDKVVSKLLALNYDDMQLYKAALNLRAKRLGFPNYMQQFMLCC